MQFTPNRFYIILKYAVFFLFLLPAPLHAQTLGQLNDQIVTLFNQGEYAKAIPLLERSVQLTKEEFGEKNSNYIQALNVLATLYLRTGNYTKAEKHAYESSKLWKIIGGEYSKDYLGSLNILGSIYLRLSRYKEAEEIFIQVIANEKKARGEKSENYATMLSNLADFYAEKGFFEKAEPLLLQEREIRIAVAGKNDIGYTKNLTSLSLLYWNMGNYEKALNFFDEVITIDKKILGENHPDYIKSLVQGAMFLIEINQPEKAEPTLQNALKSIKNTNGEMNLAYANTLSMLGMVYFKTDRTNEALTALTKSLSITEQVLGKQNQEYATCLNNIAVVNKNLGELKKAEALYIESREIRRKLFGEYHSDYENSLENLSILYLSAYEYEKAVPLIIASGDILLRNMARNFLVLSEKEKSNLVNANLLKIDYANSALFTIKNKPAALVKSNFNHLINLKSISLTDSRNTLESISKINDPSLNLLLDQWKIAKTNLSRQYALPVNLRIANIDSLTAAAESLEKELTRRSAAFRDQQSLLQVDVKDIRLHLQKDEAAIEFVKFNLYHTGWTDSVIYAAYILRKEDTVPVFVPLFEEKQLQQLFTSAGETNATTVSNLYRGLSEGNNKAPLSGDVLYKLAWQPLEPYLKNIHSVSYSPAGILFSIAFHALPVPDGQLLMDKYALHQLISTRQIVLRNTDKEKKTPGNIVLFGNPEFSMDSIALVNRKKTAFANTFNRMNTNISRGNKNKSWVNLPGTADEVNAIQQLFIAKNIQSTLFTRSAASEENFKAISQDPSDVIHMATHGFFLGNPVKIKEEDRFSSKEGIFRQEEDPLLRNGLILSGGNYVWSGKPPIEGVEDGICTAYEISQMNLSKTSLVVLSACNTALGDIKGAEGVYGLQRGFKMAGVKKMLLSLWQVPDAETAELMSMFYARWLSGKTIHESFRLAQAEMRKKYTAYYWAAFVLVE